MRRREFIAGLGGAAALPVVARAQRPAVPILFLSSERLDAPRSRRESIAIVLQGLEDQGYVEGRDVRLEYHWPQEEHDLLPVLADELVRRRPPVIIAISTPAALAVKKASVTIPLVFFIGGDPVKLGLVESFNRPGANVTGVSTMTNALGAKNVELLHTLVPQTTVVAKLLNPQNQNIESEIEEARAVAGALGLRLLVLKASNEDELDQAFATLGGDQVGALAVGSDDFFLRSTGRLVTLALRYRIPTIYPIGQYVAAGGLMSFGPNNDDLWRRVGIYAGRVLNGEKPAELPVQQPTKFRTAINLKTAEAIGLTIPETLLATADEVIQ
jgi:putative tryptophan/tyrosine transport system substrate-binding protein